MFGIREGEPHLYFADLCVCLNMHQRMNTIIMSGNIVQSDRQCLSFDFEALLALR